VSVFANLGADDWLEVDVEPRPGWVLTSRAVYAMHVAARMAIAMPWWSRADLRVVQEALRAYDKARPPALGPGFMRGVLGGFFAACAARAVMCALEVNAKSGGKP
jgi:hypothetical protein